MVRLAVPDVGQVLAGWSVAQWSLRSGQVVSTLVALLAIGGSGSGLPAFWVVLALGVSVWAFFSPDSTAPTILIVFLVAGWWIRSDDPVSGWLVVFAIAVFAIHVLTAAAAAGPPAAHYGRELVVRWSWSSGLVLAGIVAMWVVLMLLTDASVAASNWRLVVALLAVALLAGWLRLRSVGDPDDPRLARRQDLRQ